MMLQRPRPICIYIYAYVHHTYIWYIHETVMIHTHTWNPHVICTCAYSISCMQCHWSCVLLHFAMEIRTVTQVIVEEGGGGDFPSWMLSCSSSPDTNKVVAWWNIPQSGSLGSGNTCPNCSDIAGTLGLGEILSNYPDRICPRLEFCDLMAFWMYHSACQNQCTFFPKILPESTWTNPENHTIVRLSSISRRSWYPGMDNHVPHM